MSDEDVDYDEGFEDGTDEGFEEDPEDEDISVMPAEEEFIVVTKDCDPSIKSLVPGSSIIPKGVGFYTQRGSHLVQKITRYNLSELESVLHVEMPSPNISFNSEKMFIQGREADTEFLIKNSYDLSDPQTYDCILSLCNPDNNTGVITCLLEWAIRNSYEDIMDHILDSNTHSFYPYEMYEFCMDRGKFSIAKRFIERIDLALNGTSILMTACECSSIEVFQMILDLGVELDTRCLAIAILSGNEPMISYILDRSDPNTKWHCLRDMMPAHMFNKPYILRKFKSQLNPNESALSIATLSGNLDLVIKLVELGATVDPSDESLITRGIYHSNVKMIKFLLGLGAEVSDSAVEFAIMRGEEARLEIIQLVIPFISPEGILGSLERACQFKYFDGVKFILDYGCDISDLSNACLGYICEDSKILQLVIDRGFDLSKETCLEVRPIANRNLDVIRILIQNGYPTQGVAETCCMNGDLEMIKVVFEMGAPGIDIDGLAPYTAIHDNVHMLDYLVRNGLDLNKSSDVMRQLAMIQPMVKIKSYLDTGLMECEDK